MTDFKGVFFSWNHNDANEKDYFVSELRNFLGGRDMVWESDSDCSGEITEACRSAIQNCSVFVVLASEHSIKSQWVKREVEWAMEHLESKYIVLIGWSGDYASTEPFCSLYKRISGIDNGGNEPFPTKAQSEALNAKVRMAINAHALENYYSSDVFSKQSMLDLVQENAEDVRDGMCNFDDIWVNRRLYELNESGAMLTDEADVSELLNDGPSLVVGEGGCGKSWLLKKLQYDLLKEGKDKAIFDVKLKDFAQYLVAFPEGNLARYLLENKFRQPARVFGYTELNFLSLLQTHSDDIFLFFDGMDEVVSEKHRELILHAIQQFFNSYPAAKGHAAFTSRNFTDKNRTGANKAYRLARLNDDERGELAKNMFVYLKCEDKKDGFILALKDINEEIRANPFFFTQLAKIYAADGNLPRSYGDIYERSVNQYLSRESDRESIPDGLLNRLPKAAYFKYMADSQGDEVTFRSAYVDACDGDEDLASRDFRYLVRRAIVKNDAFSYQIFMDFYVAKYVVALSFKKDEFGDVMFRDRAIVKLTEQLKKNESWDNISKIVLSMVETHNAKLYNAVFEKFCTCERYDLLLDIARDILIKENIKGQSRLIVARLLVTKTVAGEYSPYGELFQYTPIYGLFNEVAMAVSEAKSKIALCLFRDLCFIFANINKVTELKDVSDKVKTQLLELCAAIYADEQGRRAYLCRLFYGLEAPSLEELKKQFTAVFPVEFCVLYAANRMNECEIELEGGTFFEDEDGLFKVNDKEKSVGLIAVPNDYKTLEKIDYSRVTALILLPTENTELQPIARAKPLLRYFSMANNISNVNSYALNFCPELRYVNLSGKIDTFEPDWCAMGRDLFLHFPCSKAYKVLSCDNEMPIFLRSFRSDGTIEIDDYTFSENYKKLNFASLPGRLKKIGDEAFDQCRTLSLTTLPESLTIIGDGAFKGCTSLALTSLPKGLRNIGYETFSGCTSLALTTLPDNIRVIGCDAFSDCTSLVLTSLPENLKNLGGGAFEGCISLSLTSLPAGLRHIQCNTFKGCRSLSLTSLPDDIYRIDYAAFEGCTSLALTELPKSLKVLESNAFCGCCSLALTYIPNGIEKIEPLTFKGCTSLRLHYFPDNLKSIAPEAFQDCSDEILSLVNRWNNSEKYIVTIPAHTTMIAARAYYGQKALQDIVLPESLGSIGDSAFENCSSLKHILLPNSIKKIGACAFKGCESLTTISIPESLNVIEREVFSGCNLLSLSSLPVNLEEIGDNAFEGCRSLALIALPSKLKKIHNGAFKDCTSLALTSLPEGITEMGYNTFSGCTSLALKTLPEGLKKIHDGAFEYCTLLALTSLPEGITEIGNFAFHGCSSLELEALPEGLKKLNCCTFGGCTALTLTFLPEGITEIGGFAFHGCSSLALKALPEGLKEINLCTFEGCTALALTFLPNGLESLHYGAFKGCTSLKLTSLPEKLTSIQENAFEGCTALALKSLPKGLKVIDKSAFAGCTSLTLSSLPEGLWKVESNAFENCCSLTTMSFPHSMKEIFRSAFRGCTALKSITFFEGLQEIYYGAFEACPIEELKIPLSVQYIGDNAFKGHNLKHLEIFIGFKSRISAIFGHVDEKIITWLD